MSIAGNAAIESAMQDLQRRVETNEHLSPELQLEKLKEAIEEIRKAAECGWY